MKCLWYFFQYIVEKSIVVLGFFCKITRTELLSTTNIILLQVAWDCIDQDQGFKCEQDTLLDPFLTEKREKWVWEKKGVTLKT